MRVFRLRVFSLIKKPATMEVDVAIKTDMQARAAQLPEGKLKAKFAVDGGLFLLVTIGGKYWKYAYTYNDK